MSAQPPELRADARRNRDAVLDAARAEFARSGLGVPMDAVARRAGVGRATLYRRFPERDDLVRAIFEEDLLELERVADAHGDRPTALAALLEITAELLAANRGFGELLLPGAGATAVREEATARFLGLLERPLRDARVAGLIRSDVTQDDLLLAVTMICGAAMAFGSGEAGPGFSDAPGRAVAVVLGGLAPRGGA